MKNTKTDLEKCRDERRTFIVWAMIIFAVLITFVIFFSHAR